MAADERIAASELPARIPEPALDILQVSRLYHDRDVPSSPSATVISIMLQSTGM